MESARRPISAVPWSMRRRSSKTSGLRPWSSSISRSSLFCWWTIAWTRRAMLTKARCAESRIASSRSMIVEHGLQQVALRLGEFTEIRIGLVRGCGSPPRGMRRRAVGASPTGSDLVGEVQDLVVVGGDALFQVCGAAGQIVRADRGRRGRAVPLRRRSRRPGASRWLRTSRRRHGPDPSPRRRRLRSPRPSLWPAATARARREVHGHREAIEHSPCMPSETSRLGDRGSLRGKRHGSN